MAQPTEITAARLLRIIAQHNAQLASECDNRRGEDVCFARERLCPDCPRRYQIKVE